MALMTCPDQQRHQGGLVKVDVIKYVAHEAAPLHQALA